MCGVIILFQTLNIRVLKDMQPDNHHQPGHLRFYPTEIVNCHNPLIIKIVRFKLLLF